MKNYRYKPMWLVVAFLFFVSCKKGLLDETPYSFLSSDYVYNTKSGAEAAVAGAWATCADYGMYSAGYPTVLHVASGGFNTSQPPAKDLNALTFNASSLWLNGGDVWEYSYRAIKNVNDIIEHMPGSTIDDADFKNRILGEAHLIRGMLYFNLVRMYGGVPLRLKPVSVDEVNKARASATEVLDQVVTDLTVAKEKMGAPGSGITVGRPHKFAAYALLGKVYIWMAGNDENSTYWQKAKDELLQVYNSGAYQLESSVTKLFDIANENNKESVIEIQYSKAGGFVGHLTNHYSPPQSNLTPAAIGGPFGWIKVNKEIFDKHVELYPGDPRIAAFYVYGQYTRMNGTTQPVYPNNTAGFGFPYLKKYLDPQFISGGSNRNFYYLRYADVLLSLAEAENEINGPAAAYKYVNDILARARVKPDATMAPQPAAWSGMAKETFRQRILLERRCELIGECTLWYDVRRKGKDYFFNFLEAHNKYPKLNLAFDKIYPVDERLMRFPIPANEMNSNTMIDQKDQNPGY